MAKIAALILVSAVLILSALVTLALVNLNGYLKGHRERLISDIERRLGAQVSTGKISMMFWGGVGIKMDSVAVKVDTTLASGPWLRADHARVNVKFSDLLRNRVKVKNVSLRRPVLTVSRFPEDRFDSPPPAPRRLANSPGGGAPTERKGTVVDASSGAARLHRGLMILLRDSNVKIDDGEIRFKDGSGNIQTVARNVAARLEALKRDRAASVEITAAVLEAERPNLRLRAFIGPWPADARARALPVKGWVETGDLNLGALKRLFSGAVRVPSGMVATGPAALKIEWRGNLEHLVVKGTMNATSSFIAAGKCCVKPSGVPLLLAVEAHVTESRIAIRRARVELGAMVFEAVGEFDRWMPVSMRVTVDSQPIKLAHVKTIVPSLRRYKLSGYAKLHSQVRGELGRGKRPRVSGMLSLPEMNFTLPGVGAAIAAREARLFVATKESGASRKTANVKAPRQPAAPEEPGSPSAIRYEFHAPELRLSTREAGLGAGAGLQIIKDARSTGSFDSSGGSPVGRGEFYSGNGTLSRWNYAQLTGAFRVADDFISVEHFYVKFLEGSIEGYGDYRFAESPSRFRLSGRGQKLNLASLRDRSFAGSPEHFRGRLDLSLDLDGRIHNGAPAPIVVRAQGEARVTGGAIPEINLPEEVLASANGLEHISRLLSYEMRKKYPQIFHAKGTRFENLKASFTLQNDKLRVDDLNLSGVDYIARGNGWIDARGNVDLRAVLGLSGDLAADLAYDLGDAPLAQTQDGYQWIPFSVAGVFPRLHSDAVGDAAPVAPHHGDFTRGRSRAGR